MCISQTLSRAIDHYLSQLRLACRQTAGRDIIKTGASPWEDIFSVCLSSLYEEDSVAAKWHLRYLSSF